MEEIRILDAHVLLEATRDVIIIHCFDQIARVHVKRKDAADLHGEIDSDCLLRFVFIC